ncbi:NADH dehydrogenase [ubiquinone] 1 beta subcomplex subunit 3 [Eupeodes corollae]|uniref:NADH dehydrogenase [ubiquinone] 1 beta subcomplex subunit 3 n=1 Tax=Eupeodes corollae TaxID=290404 RepID=UPI002491A355|nr:NADH dehydrogenase [ubiquinone] 1 beta subcomplex subunit 3 [Eupeodes corollae]XP_055919583.1 NADH dehydrogenase [ubiquinone] 1 beta subcomplex subunit 3 [Eupeodes corollae]XP_055919584.1 NADH dehydrogenase [ubiquinone] 1 beta subcomplex subunit 3 [Eupeodes corollae]
MGGHGHGHGDAYKVPDASIYKVEAPQLVEVQESLARLGLKDPWARNEAWRYLPKHGTHASRARIFFTRGFVWGLAAALITVGIEKGLSSGDEHGHGHGEHH